MRRLRIFFAAFGVALVALVGLLVQRSLESVALEQRTRQQAVAERIFDEMERSLSRLLDREEQRPVENYENAPGGRNESFVIGRFQLDAASTATAEPAPAGQRRAAIDGLAPSRELAPKASGVMPENEFDSALDSDTDAPDGLDAAVADYFRSPAAPNAKKEAPPAQAPGTTVRLDGEVAEQKGEALGGTKQKREVSEYDALRSLNKALEERAVGRARTRDRRQADESRPAARLDDNPAVAEVLDLRADAFGRARMSGRAITPQRMMLYRTVATASALYQQGVLLDVNALGTWLRERSIGGAPYATVDVFAAGSEQAQPIAPLASSFRHRFAPPFADLSAHLRLQPLTSGDSSLYVQALSATLLGATLVGLVLLYRTVSVTVRFAERRSNFVAAVSHELKTPLTAIRMYGEMLRDGIVPSEAKRAEYYRHITNESERLSRLINNVLEYAKLEKGERPVQLTAAALAPTVAEVVDTMAPHAAELGFAIELDIEEGLPAVRFEADALMQVLWNLIDNAIKYSRGAPDRRIHLRVDRDGGDVRIAVRDRGPGVEDRHLGDIFEPFYRSENELTRSSKGTGLGLALVRGLVGHMGATVEAHNAPGGGFVVEIRFPAAR